MEMIRVSDYFLPASQMNLPRRPAGVPVFLPDLFGRLLLFFPVLVRNDKNDYNSEKNNPGYGDKSKYSITHIFSPLSRIVARKNNAITPIIPPRARNNFVFTERCGVTIGPRTTIPRISLPQSNNVFARFSLCFCANLISGRILSKAKIFVKQIVSINPSANSFHFWERGAGGFFVRQRDFCVGGIFRESLSD